MPVNEEIIKDPGKFEGEPVWVRELWELTLDGSEDDEITLDREGKYASIFYNSKWDEPIMPESFHAVAVWESDNGFVNWTGFLSEREVDNFRTENEYDEEHEETED